MKAIVSTLYSEGLNKRNWQLLEDLFSPEYTGRGGIKGAAGFLAPILPMTKAFPDIQWKIEDIFEEGDKVAVRWQWHGTHRDTFTLYPPTGKVLTNDGMAIFSFKDGKIIDAQLQTDRLGFVQQASAPVKDQTCLIDKFFVPAAAKAEFFERMKINRDLIRTIPGFIEDAAYTYTDDSGNLICVTVARWQNMDAINKAKEAVQTAYKRENFDMPAMLKRLNISIDRGIYQQMIE